MTSRAKRPHRACHIGDDEQDNKSPKTGGVEKPDEQGRPEQRVPQAEEGIGDVVQMQNAAAPPATGAFAVQAENARQLPAGGLEV